MFSSDDLAASVPHVVGDAEVLPNLRLCGLPGTAERKHPEHIVDKVEKALPKDEN
jgi:hypothetical protein